jgi:hypothetical protein
MLVRKRYVLEDQKEGRKGTPVISIEQDSRLIVDYPRSGPGQVFQRLVKRLKFDFAAFDIRWVRIPKSADRVSV